MSVVEAVGSVLAVLTWVELWAFVVLYHVLSHREGTPWWRDGGGWLVMGLAASEGSVLALATLRLAAGAELDAEWFALVRTAVFAAVPVVVGACIYALWRLYHPRGAGQPARHRHQGDDTWPRSNPPAAP